MAASTSTVVVVRSVTEIERQIDRLGMNNEDYGAILPDMASTSRPRQDIRGMT